MKFRLNTRNVETGEMGTNYFTLSPRDVEYIEGVRARSGERAASLEARNVVRIAALPELTGGGLTLVGDPLELASDDAS